MQEFRRYSFVEGPTPRAKLRRMLASVGLSAKAIADSEVDGLFIVKLAADDPRTELLVEALDRTEFQFPWHYEIEVHYDNDDLQASAFAHIHVDRAPRGDTGPDYGTEYDYSAGCPACGTGARQVSPLRINASALSKSARITQTYRDEVVIDERLAAQITEVIGKTALLRQVEDRRHSPLPWFQLLPTESMPPADPATGHRVVRDQCPECKRDGFGYAEHCRRPEYTYRLDQADPSTLPDLVFTWEHAGTSRLKPEGKYLAHLASPSILVSRRVKDVFLQNKIKAASFVPARFI